jgi:hypothetical protein
MNPYELADELKKCVDDGFTDLVCVCDAANMLRQQTDRIAELEKELQSAEVDIDVYRHEIAELEKSQMAWYEAGKFVTPQIKELSDEEISLVISESYQSIGNATLTDLCKAILKKASEK